MSWFHTLSVANTTNAVGICVSGIGSIVAMAGVVLQMNGYFAVKQRDLLEQFGRVVRYRLFAGSDKMLDRVRISTVLGEAKKEDRGKSLLGFYLVFTGFLLQMMGAGFLFRALFL